MFTGILLGLFIIIGSLFARSITTLFHELGHAIPALIYTPNRVVVHIGSYGDVAKSLHLTIGRLDIYFQLNLLAWNLGMCTHEGELSIGQRLLILFGGPVFSVLLAVPLFTQFFNPNVNDLLRFIIAVFFAGAVFDFFVNIIPVSRPIVLHNGNVTYNDGQQIAQLLSTRNYPDEYFEALEALRDGRKEDALDLFEKLIENGFIKKKIYQHVLDILMEQQNYKAARNCLHHMMEHFQPTGQDFSTLGLIELKQANYHPAITYLNRAIHEDHQNTVALNHRGYAFLQIKEYREAGFDLNNAIYLNPMYAEAYANRALWHVNNNDWDAAEADLDMAQALKEDLPYHALHWGMYHEKRRNFALALEHYEKAKALKVDYRKIDLLIEEMERRTTEY